MLVIHFEDFSGNQFERLAFAYIFRVKAWLRFEWLGQVGSDGGRDIWGVAEDNFGREVSYCFQCANYRSIPFDKARTDVDKLVKNNTLPDRFTLICGGTVAARTVKKINDYAISQGIKQSSVWNGAEFEERLRRDTPSLLQRFVFGEQFPDTTQDLTNFINIIDKARDEEILSLMGRCFDRPAFKTRFMREVSLSGFKQAVTDTIEALNTGVYRTRQGQEITRIPSKHNLTSEKIRQTISEVVDDLVELRRLYDDLIQKGDIWADGIGRTHVFSDRACQVMDLQREKIISKFKSVYPSFSISWLEEEHLPI